MSYLLKSDSIVINAKLTSIGRKLIASGSLTYAKYALGDSEIDYTENNIDDNAFDLGDSMILSPKDKYPNIKYFITKTENGNNLEDLTILDAPQGRIINSAKERGFFNNFNLTGSTVDIQISSDYIVNGGTLDLNSTGSNVITVNYNPYYSSLSGYTEPIIGDYILVQYQNPNLTGTTVNGVINTNEPTPMLWYKIESISGTLSGGTADYTIDRITPNFSGLTADINVYFYPGGNSIEEYYTKPDATYSSWSENTLSFNGSCNLVNDDVPVWNMSLIYPENVVGLQDTNEQYDKYNTFYYKGQRIYLGLDIPAIGIIHYSNFSFSNYYGESLVDNTPILELPGIMWHGSTNGKMGVTLVCGGTAQVDIHLNTKYYDLVDSQNEVVGRCYNDLKIFVITNTDLIMAMSYKSNRNWTLPSPTADIIESFGGISIEDRAFINPNTQDLYVTYIFENTATSFGSQGYGYTTAMPYAMYKIGDKKSNSDYCFLSFNINPSKLPFLRNSTQLSGGTGWSTNLCKVLVQVTNTNEPPVSDQWKVIDITDRLIDYATWNTTCLPSTAFNPTIPIIIDKDDYNNATLFDINDYIPLPNVSGDETKLQFGDEVFFWGNIKTDIESIYYQTTFTIVAGANDYNFSTNPTWVTGQSVAVSEIGIYSVNDELVAIAKFNYPIEKLKNQLKIFSVKIEF